jgi:PP-loop superfamily ATP-utilizing enzyme
MKQLGYAHVTLDLAGYRRGSLNETPVAFASVKRIPVG